MGKFARTEADDSFTPTISKLVPFAEYLPSILTVHKPINSNYFLILLTRDEHKMSFEPVEAQWFI